MSELGEITRCYTLRYERRSKHTAARVWRAITDSEEVSRWMAFAARIDLRVGGEYFVDFAEDSEEDLEGVIVRVEPGRHLAYVWGVTVVEWQLAPDGDGCRYTFSHHGMQRRDIPDEHGVAVGWHIWLDDLESFMSGRELAGNAPDALARLVPAYRERLAAALG